MHSKIYYFFITVRSDEQHFALKVSIETHVIPYLKCPKRLPYINQYISMSSNVWVCSSGSGFLLGCYNVSVQGVTYISKDYTALIFRIKHSKRLKFRSADYVNIIL
jgi:hypothetical protein